MRPNSLNIQVPQHIGGSSRAELWPQSRWWGEWWKPGTGTQTCSTSDETWKRHGNMWERAQHLLLQNMNCRAIRTSSYQMLLRMKKSWMKMQPKGRIPPITIPGIGFVKNDCSGIWRGIWFVRTGCSIAYTAAEIENKSLEKHTHFI